MKFAVLFLSLFIFISAYAGQLTVEEKTLDFQQLVGRIKASYGPLDYKKEILGIDIDKLQADYLRRVQESKNNEDFYYLITQFIAEFKDSHFGSSLPTDRRAVMPFHTDLVQNKVLVSSVSDEVKTIKKGDEITHFDGVPIQEVLKKLMTYNGEGYAPTQKRMAAWILTSRRSARVPGAVGKVVVTFKPQGKHETRHETFEWIITGSDLPEQPTQAKTFRQSRRPTYLTQLSIKSKMADLVGDGKKVDRDFYCSGTSRIEVPQGATQISTEPFVSYYWPTAKGNIGYVRIPHFSPEGDDEIEAIKLYFAQYEKVIYDMEKNTVGLVIDQDHNCGGYVELVNKMVGLFMDKPYRPMSFKLVANKENVLDYKTYADEMDHLTMAYDMAMNVFNLLKVAWQKGNRLTDFTSLDGDEWIAPNMIHYTKPVVMLIDEMSASGGDAYPSMMQGYGRAKLIGTRTMGAGGHVSENAPLNYSQITVNMTRSLFYRPDGVAVENNGAVPDFSYDITTDDFINGYKGYRSFYTQKILDLISQTSK